MTTMPQTVPYVHYLDGRIRLHVPAIKGAPAQARALEALVRTLTGVTGVSAHPTTGHVLILFAVEIIRPEVILEALQKAGYPASACQPAQPRHHTLTTTVVQSAVQLALERLLLALWCGRDAYHAAVAAQRRTPARHGVFRGSRTAGKHDG